MLAVLCWALLLVCAVNADHLPPAIPLAVKSPYLSVWAAGNLPLNEQTPYFYTMSNLGWRLWLRTGAGKTYNLLGKPLPHVKQATQLAAVVTSTRSIFSFAADQIELQLTFFSPVEPENLLFQSLPFSYLSVDVLKSDTNGTLSLYSEISTEFLSGDRSKSVFGFECGSRDVVALCSQLEQQTAFVEIEDQAEHGTLIWATLDDRRASFSFGEAAAARKDFLRHGQLDNAIAVQALPIESDAVLSLVKDVSLEHNAVFVIGLERDPVIQYRKPNGEIEDRSLLYTTQFHLKKATRFFLDDFERALQMGHALDKQIQDDSAKFSQGQAALSAYSVRQVYASMEITVGKHKDVMIFMKEISSNGNMNTVDVLFPAMPLLYYLSPDYIPMIVEPLLQFQQSQQWHERFALHDVGARYPNATGHSNRDDSEAMPLEETGDMMLLVLAYAQATDDLSMLKRYPDLFQKWAEELEETALHPSNQLSTDDFMGFLPNQTSLSLKGVLGLAAYSQLSTLNGDSKRAHYYRRLSKRYFQKFENLTLSKDGSHTKLAFHQDDSWSLLYNIYMDKLLDLNLVSDRVYELQIKIIELMDQLNICDGQRPQAMGLDNRRPLQLTPWLAFQAAAIFDRAPEVAHSLIDSLVAYAQNGKNIEPFGDRFDVCHGKMDGFRARPTVGGHFALLALQKAQRKRAALVDPQEPIRKQVVFVLPQ